MFQKEIMCDLYLFSESSHAELKSLSIFDQSFNYNVEKVYKGWLNVNIERLKLVTLVSRLKAHNVKCASVPIQYRDNKLLSYNECLTIAKTLKPDDFAINSQDKKQSRYSNNIPFFTFGLAYTGDGEEPTGAIINIDRLTGHTLTDHEYHAYLYDFNQIV